MGVLATDDFNRSNGGLGANWATITSEGSPVIATNVVEIPAGVDGAARYTAVTAPADQYAQVKVITLNSGADRCGGVALRAASGAKTYYRILGAGPFGASAKINIEKKVTGTYTGLTSVTVTLAANDVVRGEVQSNALAGFVNGVSKTTTTDSAIASGQFGIAVFTDTGSTGDARVDDWEGGDLAASVSRTPTIGSLDASGVAPTVSRGTLLSPATTVKI